MAEKEVVIVDAVRTAFGRMGGTLKDIYASKLGSIGIDGLLNKTKIMEKWNPMGGAIAFGHPNGASGARICMFAMRHMIRNKGRYGVFGSCCGGGLGVATVIENLHR